MNRLKNKAYRLLFAAATRTTGGATIRLGSRYGGWTIPADGVRTDSVVYSGGLGEDASFDLELIRRHGCDIWVFDPTPRAIAYAETIREDKFHFRALGLWSTDGPQSFFPPKDSTHVSHSIPNIQGASTEAFVAMCRSLVSLMNELGHRRIDLLKLDVEGAEFEVLSPVASGEISPRILAIEFHPRSLSRLRTTIRFVRELKDRGYEVLAREDWNLTLARD